MSTSKVFSIEGQGLKLTTAEDIAPHIQALKSNDAIEEVRFLGNTLGIGASEALAKVLEGKKNLKVPCAVTAACEQSAPDMCNRLQTSPTSLPRACCPRFRLRCRT